MNAPNNILVLEDDPLLRVNLIDALEDRGQLCRGAETVAQAFEMNRHAGFDAILCDHDLPDGTGLDLLELLRRDQDHTPVVYASAAPPGLLEKAAAFPNVRAVLPKPVDPERLLEVLLEESRRDRDVDPDDQHPRLIGRSERDMLLANELFNPGDPEPDKI